MEIQVKEISWWEGVNHYKGEITDCFTHGNKESENLLWRLDMRRVKACPLGCSRLCKPALSWGQAGAASAAEPLEAPGWDFFITLGSHFPPQWRLCLGMNGEPFFLCGDHGTRADGNLSGVPRAAWFGHLKFYGLMNVQSASYISVMLLGFRGFCWNMKCQNDKRKCQNKFRVLHFATS